MRVCTDERGVLATSPAGNAGAVKALELSAVVCAVHSVLYRWSGVSTGVWRTLCSSELFSRDG